MTNRCAFRTLWLLPLLTLALTGAVAQEAEREKDREERERPEQREERPRSEQREDRPVLERDERERRQQAEDRREDRPRPRREQRDRPTPPEGPASERRQDRIIEHAIRELHEIGNHECANRLEQRMRSAASRLRERSDGPTFRGPGGPMERGRMTHLEQAIGHLREAGLHEEAERLQEKHRHAEEMTARQQRRGGGPEGPPMDDLREKVERLQNAVHELQEQVAQLRERMER